MERGGTPCPLPLRIAMNSDNPLKPARYSAIACSDGESKLVMKRTAAMPPASAHGGTRAWPKRSREYGAQNPTTTAAMIAATTQPEPSLTNTIANRADPTASPINSAGADRKREERFAP